MDIEEKELSFLQNDNNFKCKNTVTERFERNAEETPQKIALVLRDKTMTYQELNRKSNQLAGFLRSSRVKPNDIVGILINRSMEMFIAILAVLKAGGAYLPIDPEYPADRISYMLNDCNIKILITDSQLKNTVPFKKKTVCLDDSKIFRGDSENLTGVNSLSDLIYIIYTSGSTGLPKGTLIEHKSVVNLINGLCDVIDFNKNKTILSLASFAFDMSIPEILLPLAKGMKIVIADEEQRNNPVYLSDCIIKNKVDMLQITPSRLQLMFNYGKNLDFLNRLTEILVGAEPFPKSLLEKLKAHTRAKIYNLYGPTETTVWSAVGELSSSDTVHAGTPISNTQLLIIDSCGKICKVGQEGELCISGEGLSRGYLGRPELTNEKFVSSKYLDGKKLYRTGDLAKILPNKTLEVLGRIDSQVKLNGKRVELGEIEYQLIKYDGIKNASVIVKDNTLCAFYESDSSLDGTRIKEHLQKFLPNYMVPVFYKRIDKIPLNFNGKVDKKALSQLEITSKSQCRISNPNSTEGRLRKVLAGIIPDKTSAMEVPLKEPLQNIGVDSVAFVKLIVAAECEFGIEFDDQYLDFTKLPTLSSVLFVVEGYLKNKNKKKA